MYVNHQQGTKEVGRKEFSLEVNDSNNLPVKDIEVYLTDARQAAVGVQLGRVCFGSSY